MIASKEIPDSSTAEPKVSKPKKSAASKPAAANATEGPRRTQTNTASAKSHQQPATPDHSLGPSVHLDIQIHVPADATPEQIDQIFASMAKHLYQR